jgi:hypothetical protein
LVETRRETTGILVRNDRARLYELRERGASLDTDSAATPARLAAYLTNTDET